jgi:cell division protein FtsW
LTRNPEYPEGYSLDSQSAIHERELRDYSTKKRKRRAPFDLPFFILTLIILSIGVVMVLSASFASAYYSSGDPTEYFIRQLGFAVLGIVAMLGISLIPVQIYRRLSVYIMGGTLLLLLLVPFIGSERGGATRWIDLGFTTFQPSEIAKLAVIICFSAMICTYGKKMKTFRYGVLPFGVILAAVVGLLVLEPHLSASIIIIAVGAIMMFAGGTRLYWFLGIGALTGGAGYIAITKLDYAARRIATWRDPLSDLQGDGWQIIQSLYAVGSGGFLGLGLGQGRQKYLYLPEEHNDFIFAVVCEELGFVGAALILILFALLIVRGYWLAMHARDKFSALLVTGITSLLAIQVFLNVAVVTNLLPCTGISLPFFSYGGTALLLQMAEMGIVLSVSRDIPLKTAKVEKTKESESTEAGE